MKNVDDDDDKYKFSQNQNVNGSFICMLADVCVCVCVFRMQIYRPKNIKLIFEFFYLEKKVSLIFVCLFPAITLKHFWLLFKKISILCGNVLLLNFFFEIYL